MARQKNQKNTHRTDPIVGITPFDTKIEDITMYVIDK